MKSSDYVLALAMAIPLGLGLAHAGPNDNESPKDVISFGSLRPWSHQEGRALALKWLKENAKAEKNSLSAFEAIWADKNRTVFEQVLSTITMAEPEAAKLLDQVGDFAAPAPTGLPALLTDPKRSTFFKANLALAYARSLSQRRIYEESLEALKLARVEHVAEPGTYLFHKAVAEHSLLLREDATRTIMRLFDDATDVPERYRMLALLMAFDMQGWREKDLGEIARKMDNIERRLDLARGGKQTQKIQKEVVARLDEIIKQLENQAKGD